MSDNLFLIPLVAMIICIALGLFGPPLPWRASERFLWSLLSASAIFLAASIVALIVGSLNYCAVLGSIWACLFMICVWLAHPPPSPPSDSGWGGGGGHGPRLTPPPPDWKAFDRERARWNAPKPEPARPREREGAGV